MLGATASFEPTIMSMSTSDGNDDVDYQDASKLFHHALDSSRLGRRHDSLASFTSSIRCDGRFAHFDFVLFAGAQEWTVFCLQLGV